MCNPSGIIKGLRLVLSLGVSDVSEAEIVIHPRSLRFSRRASSRW